MPKGFLNYCLKIFDSEVINKLGKKQKGVNKLKMHKISLWPKHLFCMYQTFTESPL